MDSKVTQATLALLRILIGWHFFYEGIIKIIDPAWSARPFLEGSRWIFGMYSDGWLRVLQVLQ